tara:strand:+ start:2414 stop:2611 length:198 start_codon:yes stop_codon:yes gene_type:complete
MTKVVGYHKIIMVMHVLTNTCIVLERLLGHITSTVMEVQDFQELVHHLLLHVVEDAAMDGVEAVV